MSSVDQFRALVATCTTAELAVALLDPTTAVKVKAALAKADAAPQDPLQASIKTRNSKAGVREVAAEIVARNPGVHPSVLI